MVAYLLFYQGVRVLGATRTAMYGNLQPIGAIAFYGIWTTEAVLTVMVTTWALKVVWEAMLTPVTYVVVNRLKAAEGVDLFDIDTDFSPFGSSEKP